MTRRLQVLAACAALLAPAARAAGNETALGRFVEVPYALLYAAPASLADIHGIRVDGATYRALCALGDMSLERLYVPSAGGWASAPWGYALTAMAEAGWEVPAAARHARLYDLAYACLTNPAPRLDLPGGFVKVYPLTYGGGVDLGGIARYAWTPSAPEPDVNALGLGAACGGLGFAGESACTPVVADLRALLTSHGFGGPAADPGAARAAAVSSAMRAYAAAAGDGDFAAHNYLARGGIRAGDPLRAVDPFAANWWMSKMDTVPVLVPAGAFPAATNEVTVAAYELRTNPGALRSTACALVMAGGGTAQVPATAKAVSVPAVRRPGAAQRSLEVSYRIDARKPGVWAVVERTDAASGGTWHTVGTRRTSTPTAGTLTVARLEMSGTSSYAVVDAGADDIALVDAKTNTFTSACDPPAPDVGWPHPSSEDWVGSAVAVAFGSRTYGECAPNGAERSWTEYCSFVGDPKGTAAEAVRNAVANYHDLGGLPSADDGLGTVHVKVELPDLANTVWRTSVYRTVFEADDADWEPPEDFSCTNYCQYDTGEPSSSEPGDDGTDLPDWDGTKLEGSDPAEDPASSSPGTSRCRVPCEVTVWREGEPNGGGMEYASHVRKVFRAPSVLLLVTFDFMHF